MGFLESEIRDSKEIWARDSGLHLWTVRAGFSVNAKRDPGNRHFEAPRFGISDGQKLKINTIFAVVNDGNDRKFKCTRVTGPHSLARVLAFQFHDCSLLLIVLVKVA